MGAEQFFETGTGATAEEAFEQCREQAYWDFGHSGYTGTTAEKDCFVMIYGPPGVDAYKYAEELVEKGDPRIDDKWGPAGCIDLGNNQYLFFGWASS